MIGLKIIDKLVFVKKYAIVPKKMNGNLTLSIATSKKAVMSAKVINPNNR